MLFITSIIFGQLYHYVLLDIERGGCGRTCLAVRLHLLVQELSRNGLHVDERSVRDEVKRRYGKSSADMESQAMVHNTSWMRAMIPQSQCVIDNTAIPR